MNQKCQVSVTFTPTALGKQTGTLSFTDNAANSPQTVAPTGTGVEPATLTPASATYAQQAVGTSSAAKTFTLTNNQTTTLTGIAIKTTGNFAVSAKTCTTSLAAKAKCTISVTHADRNRLEEGAIERERQRQQQPSGLKSHGHGQVNQPLPQPGWEKEKKKA